VARAGFERVFRIARRRKGCSGAHRVAMGQRRTVAGPPVERLSAVVRHGVPHFGRAVSRRSPPEVGRVVRFGGGCLPLRYRYSIVILAVAVPRFVGIGRAEAI